MINTQLIHIVSVRSNGSFLPCINKNTSDEIERKKKFGYGLHNF